MPSNLIVIDMTVTLKSVKKSMNAEDDGTKTTKFNLNFVLNKTIFCSVVCCLAASLSCQCVCRMCWLVGGISIS